MHANIEQLLKIRDNDMPDPALVDHVTACSECAAQLEQLKITRAKLKALPELESGSVTWQAILDRRAIRQQAPRPGWHAPVFGLAASIVMAVALLLLFNKPFDAPPEDIVGVPDDSSPLQLLAQSQRLEQALRALPQQQVMRAGTAWTISELEDRVAMVDYQLTYANQLGLTDYQAQRLLRDRVALMNSLVQVRYAQYQRAEF